MLYGHGDPVPVTTFILLTSLLLAEMPACPQASQRLFDNPPLVVKCRVEVENLIYSVVVRREPERVLSSLVLHFRGEIGRVSTPTGWTVKQERSSEERGTAVSWSAQEAVWKHLKKPITFEVVVSGPNARLTCGESRSYARKDGGTEGGTNGCPIG